MRRMFLWSTGSALHEMTASAVAAQTPQLITVVDCL